MPIINVHDGGHDFICDQCGRLFHSNDAPIEHPETMESPNEAIVTVCNECWKELQLRAAAMRLPKV